MVVEDGKGRVQLSVGEIEQEMQMEKLNWQYSLISERPAAKNTPELVCGHKQQILRNCQWRAKAFIQWCLALNAHSITQATNASNNAPAQA